MQKGTINVHFLLSNKKVVSLEIRIMSSKLKSKTKSYLEFIPKDELIESPKDGISDLDLMKAMIRGDNVVNYKIIEKTRWVRSKIKNLHLKLVKIYSGNKYNGLVFSIKNNSKKNFIADIRSLTLGGPGQVILAQIDDKIILPKGHTLLRLVAKASTETYSLKIPFTQSK